MVLRTDAEKKLPRAHRWIEFIVFFRTRRRIARDHALRQSARNSAFDEVQKQMEKAREAGFSSFAGVHNVSLYLLLLDQDLQDYVLQFTKANGHGQRVFAARGLAVLLYEAAEDIPELFGKQYRALLSKFSVPDDIMALLNDGVGRVNAFKKQNADALKKIRSYVGAHRDKDAAKQIEVLAAIEPFAVFSMAPALTVGLSKLLETQTQITAYFGLTFRRTASFIEAISNS